ncbi:phage head closure protein [Anaerovorax odorimutans]|uniref:Phage head closure protein n=1 Tax=Anaerovorax odorimutans TaxID=109327 RepID=A0ABT1RR63_9FIRM|nr:phage head closure protein [Anaerovorax odorimutans]MCQ4637675.1 phage head closure protein [Anaerovorax odorimutans]
MKPLDVGRLNKQIILISFKPGKDRLHQDIREPVESKPIWATVKPQRGSEPYEAGKKQPEQQYTVTIRYRNGVTTDMLVKYGEKILQIESCVDVEEEHYMIELQCTEKEGAR